MTTGSRWDRRYFLAALGGSVVFAIGVLFYGEFEPDAEVTATSIVAMAIYGAVVFGAIAGVLAATRVVHPVSIVTAALFGSIAMVGAPLGFKYASEGDFYLAMVNARSGGPDGFGTALFVASMMPYVAGLFVPIAVAMAVDAKRQVPSVSVLLRFALAGLAALVVIAIELAVAQRTRQEVFDAVHIEARLSTAVFFGIALLVSLLPSRQAVNHEARTGRRIAPENLESSGPAKAALAVIVAVFVAINAYLMAKGF